VAEVLASAAGGAAADGGDVCARERDTNIPTTAASQAPALRPYQADVIGRFDAEVGAGRRRVLLVAPTGSGKTVIAAAIIAAACRDRRRVLVLAHRREITAQTVDKLYRAGVDAGVIQAGSPLGRANTSKSRACGPCTPAPCAAGRSRRRRPISLSWTKRIMSGPRAIGGS
jgi:hypothetical protein